MALCLSHRVKGWYVLESLLGTGCNPEWVVKGPVGRDKVTAPSSLSLTCNSCQKIVIPRQAAQITMVYVHASVLEFTIVRLQQRQRETGTRRGRPRMVHDMSPATKTGKFTCLTCATYFNLQLEQPLPPMVSQNKSSNR